MDQRGGPHHHFFCGGRGASTVLSAGGTRVAAAAAVVALRLSAAALRALASRPEGLSGVTLANATPAAALQAACKLTSSVRSTKAWRSASIGPEIAVDRGRQKRSCANSAKTRSASELACPLLVRRMKPNRVMAASSVAVWVRLPAMTRATTVACSGDRGWPFDGTSKPSLFAALAQLSKKAYQPMWRYSS
jgi:hypothetical protein